MEPDLSASSTTPLESPLGKAELRFRCPGESEEISDSVHLARLSSFYHKCRLCEYRSDLSRLAPVQQKQWEQLLLAPEPPRLFQTNGVRGLYLNQLTRHEASQVAAAFASTLREVAEIWRTRHPAAGPPSRWLRVIFGHDTRPSSADLAIAAATTLRQHGCELIDLSWSTRPQVEAMLRTSGADGAFCVSGQGSAVGWNGFELIGPDGIAWSLGGMLDIVEQRFHQPCPRPEREAAPHTHHNATAETMASLRSDLHGLRPLRVVIETHEPTLRQILAASMPDWPGTLTLSANADPRFLRKEHLSTIPDAPLIPAQPADVIFQLGEDGRQSELIDESHQPVSEQRILFALGQLLLSEHPHVDVVLSDNLFDRFGWTVERCGPGYLVFHRGGSTEEQLVRTMHSMNSSLGLDGEGRYWIRQLGHIRCDGLLTITMILRSLSLSDQPVSSWCLSRDW